MDELQSLQVLARDLGVHTSYTDGLGRTVSVTPETLVQVCGALGLPLASAGQAAEVLEARRNARPGSVPPVIVAWDGVLPTIDLPGAAQLSLEDGGLLSLESPDDRPSLPLGYHRLHVQRPQGTSTSRVISAPVAAWQRPGGERSWGVGAQLAALRFRRSRSVGDLSDLEALCRWVREQGGDLVALLPLLPTFNSPWPEPSPYSAVSRLFWSELMLDLGDAHHPAGPVTTLDVARADREVRAALAGHSPPDPSAIDKELRRYARFRGAQARLGRDWRDWPAGARDGVLEADQVDPEEERFHLVAQTVLRRQLDDLHHRLDTKGVRLGLDLAVGLHPDGYDSWSRQHLFGAGLSVGAPPDRGFPSGQDWGFSPVLPAASRQEGHRYLAACIGHQMRLAGVLRVDHIMAWTRLYVIPAGFSLDQGTYLSYPAEELFAVLTLESVRRQCEVVGENLGTVPPEIDQALKRHRIRGTYLTQFRAANEEAELAPPGADEVALLGSHDTPTFAGWIAGADIEERLDEGLLAAEEGAAVRQARQAAVARLAQLVGGKVEEPQEFLARALEWLGRSESPLVVPWLEDLWLEQRGVNLPGTRSSDRPNWQRPMARMLDEFLSDSEGSNLLHRLNQARRTGTVSSRLRRD